MTYYHQFRYPIQSIKLIETIKGNFRAELNVHGGGGWLESKNPRQIFSMVAHAYSSIHLKDGVLTFTGDVSNDERVISDEDFKVHRVSTLRKKAQKIVEYKGRW